MKGKILDFSIQTNTGLISGEDNKRYSFSGSEWKDSNPPHKGQDVDFDTDTQGQAVGVYVALPSTASTPASATISPEKKQTPDFITAFEAKAESDYQQFDWFMKCLKNYANFNGRARRKEYWYFRLSNLGLALLAIGLDMMLGLGDFLLVLVCIALFIPDLAVSCRRLHDIGKSGWWILIALLPLVGILLLVYWFVQDSQPDSNLYGARPK